MHLERSLHLQVLLWGEVVRRYKGNQEAESRHAIHGTAALHNRG